MKPSEFIKYFDYTNDNFPYVLHEELARCIFEHENFYNRVANQFWPESPRAA